MVIGIHRRLWRCLPVVSVLATTSWAQDGPSSLTGISREFNPAISVNGLFTGLYRSDDDPGEEADTHAHGPQDETGLHVQEVEVRLTANVDHLLKADLLFAFPGGEGVELEEGFVTTQALPGGLALRAGRIFARFGRHNLLHAHQFPFLDAPLVHQHLLGEEGLAETGLSLSWLTPLPWFVELTGEVLNGDHERFDSPEGEDLLYLADARSFFEFGSAATLEWGGSVAAGNNALEESSSLWGTDLTLKWRPRGRVGSRRSLVWQSEYLFARDRRLGGSSEEGGFYTSLQVQTGRRWWLQVRWDRLGLPEGEEESQWRTSALVAFVPSEFSSLRLQYSRQHEDGGEVNAVIAQLNFTIGSHPAHRY